MRCLLMSIAVFILLLSCGRGSDVPKQTGSQTQKNIVAAQCRECIDSILSHNQDYMRLHEQLKEVNGDAGFSYGCADNTGMFMECLRKNTAIVDLLISELNNMNNGKYSRSVIAIVLIWITAYSPSYSQVFPGAAIFEVDSVAQRITKQWSEWWASNKSLSPFDWYKTALQSGDEYRISFAIPRLADLGNKEAIPYLKDMLPKAQHVGLNNYRAIEALSRLGYRPVIPYVIRYYLRDKMGTTKRKNGIEMLKNLTSTDFGYDPQANAASRAQAIASWEKWCSAQSFDTLESAHRK